MKKINIIKQLLLGLAMLLVTNSYAQVFDITPATSGEFGRTLLPFRGVGVGFFPTGVITNAALHVNTNYMTASSNYPGIDFGEVFRTDAPNAATYWRMYRNGNEIARYWNGGTNNELNIGTIQTGTNPHLNFYAGNVQRMTILGSGSPGFVGIGTAAPVTNLQLHAPTLDYASMRFTTQTTGATGSHGLEIGMLTDPTCEGGITMLESCPLLFKTKGVAVQERMRIHYGTGYDYTAGTSSVTDVTKVAISYGSSAGSVFSSPVALLNLGANGTIVSGGKRDWMDVGIYSMLSTDQMYVGLKGEAYNDYDAVIGWGDDYNTIDNANELRFIFTGPTTASLKPLTSFDGLETGRFTSYGNFGIGDFKTTAINPTRKCEILDKKNFGNDYPATSANEPQLRLTFTQAATATPTTTGIWTDLQTTFRGDLYLHPSATGTDRRVGINRDDPRTTLEINSNGNIVTNPRSGLQFTDMTNASPRSASNGGVLSLDANGEVIFVSDIGGGNISSSCGTLPTNYITKATGSSSICTSSIYENSLNDVGIGTIAPLDAKFNIKKTSATTWVKGVSIETDAAATSLNYGCYSKQTSGSIIASYYSDINNVAPNTTNYSYFSTINGSTGSKNVGYYTSLLNLSGTTANTTSNFGFSAAIGGGGSIQSSYSYGFFVQSYNAKNNYGVWADVIPTPGFNVDNINCGGHFYAGTSYVGTTSVVEAIGVDAYGFGGSTRNVGVWAKCSGTANDNYGVKAEVYQPGSGNNYGIYASAGNTTSNYAGWFNGNVYATGVVSWSDKKLKTNIVPITNGLSIINQLKPKTFDYQTANYPSMNLPTDNHPGLIAQEVELVLPALVEAARQPAAVDSNGKVITPSVDFKGVNYTEVIPYLIAAIQEQQIQMDSLSALVLAISNGNPLSPKMANPNTIEVTLSNQNKIILNQNDPNPFAENTTINYFILDNVNAAQLLFYDNSGTILKTVEIKEKGQGSVLIYGSNLSSGVYTYTLLADGKPIETKRMVKIK